MKLSDLAFMLAAAGASALPRQDEPTSPYRFVGRVDPATRELTWPSTGVAFTFTGTSASIAITTVSGDTSVDLIVDGNTTTISHVTGNWISTPTLREGTHTVELRKRSETYFGTFRIGNIAVTGGRLVPSSYPKRKIEIVGDSISVGYGLDGDLPCTNAAALENNPLTYGALAAKALSADYSVVAWSGKGLIRNYASSPEDTSPPMPEMYTKYGGNDAASNTFTFPKTTWVPDVVVVNLGTNDFSYLNVRQPVDPKALQVAVVKLVQLVRSHYAASTVFLMGSPLLNDDYPTTADAQKTTHSNMLKAAVEELGSAGNKVYFVEWPPQGSDGVLGCDYHPNAKSQAIGAGILEAAIKSVLKW